MIMPYSSMEDVNPALRGIEPPVTLSQANAIAAVADGIPKDEVDNPWAVAISSFKKSHKVEDGKWVKKLEAGKELGQKGGAGSGNYGHAGRPGLIGGSGGSGGGVSIVQRVGDVPTHSGGMGKAYIIRKDGSIAYSEEGLTHSALIGIDPAAFGLPADQQITDRNVDDVYESLYANGNVTVRMTAKYIAFDGVGLLTSRGIQKIQDWILVDGKLPRSKSLLYAIQEANAGPKGSVVVSLDTLLLAGNVRDLRAELIGFFFSDKISSDLRCRKCKDM